MKIEKLKIENVNDLALMTPGLEVSTHAHNNSFTMRGVGTTFSSAHLSESSVAVYQSGLAALAGRTAGIDTDGFDIERIEVLRGPQNTIYGRNGVGGTINYVRKRPEWERGANSWRNSAPVPTGGSGSPTPGPSTSPASASAWRTASPATSISAKGSSAISAGRISRGDVRVERYRQRCAALPDRHFAPRGPALSRRRRHRPHGDTGGRESLRSGAWPNADDNGGPYRDRLTIESNDYDVEQHEL